ncbi:MAG: relaxase/mobilization nuclease domain-containing protein [Defluviitaleaceae bacterium]|nr:relaxase/mobilization nuclease domain-containing protein [Defluviitaleaceae bacterium]
MGTSQITPIHPNKAWGAAQTLKRTIEYLMNPDKTEGGTLVTGFECEPDVAAQDFMFARDEYRYKTGRDQGDNEILAYHVRLSFLPGETDAETASKLGWELAMELSSGNHSFVVATHTDKPHIHCHIVINAVNLDCDKKLRNELHSYKRVQRVADRICNERGLSVVENPKHSKGKSNRYKTSTKRDRLAGLIDEVLKTHQPKNFDDFLKCLTKDGCKIKRRGKTISIKPQGAERFFRFTTGKKGLPEGYDELSLRKRVAELHDVKNDEKQVIFNEETHASMVNNVSPSSHDKKINLIIDLENSIKAKDSPGYKRWAKGFSLQQAAETILFLQTHNLTDMDALTHAADHAQAEYDGLQKRIYASIVRINEVNDLQRHIGAYNKNRDVYSQYLRLKRNPTFRDENKKAIETVEAAKAFFDSLGLDKLPTIKELREEYSALSQKKYDCQQARNGMKRYVSDLQSAKRDTELLLGVDGARSNGRTKNVRSGDDTR